jgi:hypothetical protein
MSFISEQDFKSALPNSKDTMYLMKVDMNSAVNSGTKKEKYEVCWKNARHINARCIKLFFNA